MGEKRSGGTGDVIGKIGFITIKNPSVEEGFEFKNTIIYLFMKLRYGGVERFLLQNIGKVYSAAEKKQ
ncbi:hypothetical protein KA071_03245 [Candidatus Gracilibacteria bacterium]|nr:hypothetical protein [Candidatus Gracilibacteria bacterium]